MQAIQNSFDIRFQELKLANSLDLYSSKQSQPTGFSPVKHAFNKCRNCDKFIELSKITNSNEDLEKLKNQPGNYKCLDKMIEIFQKKNTEIIKLHEQNIELDNKL